VTAETTNCEATFGNPCNVYCDITAVLNIAHECHAFPHSVAYWVAFLNDKRISAQKEKKMNKKNKTRKTQNFLQKLVGKGSRHLVWNHHPNQEKVSTARLQVYDTHVPGDEHFDPCCPLNLLV
jgi:hypothetical protein